MSHAHATIERFFYINRSIMLQYLWRKGRVIICVKYYQEHRVIIHAACGECLVLRHKCRCFIREPMRKQASEFHIIDLSCLSRSVDTRPQNLNNKAKQGMGRESLLFHTVASKTRRPHYRPSEINGWHGPQRLKQGKGWEKEIKDRQRVRKKDIEEL